MVVDPETYRLQSNTHAPNSNKPVLIYRDCLPLPLSESKAKEFLESHAWIQGGTWGHIPKRHFHPNTHECYGMVPSEYRVQRDPNADKNCKAYFMANLPCCSAVDMTMKKEMVRKWRCAPVM